MNRKVEEALKKARAAVDDTSLSRDEYREVLEELETDVEARLAALKEDEGRR